MILGVYIQYEYSPFLLSFYKSLCKPHNSCDSVNTGMISFIVFAIFCFISTAMFFLTVMVVESG